MTPTLPPSQDRAFLFDWLAAVFLYEPDAATVAVLRGSEGEALLAAVGAMPGLAEDAAAIGAAVRAVYARAGSDADAAAALAARFGTLFLGAGGPGSAHPYASIYMERRTHGTATDRSVAFLASHDLAVGTAVAEPADHIAVQLAALAELSRREAVADPGSAAALYAAQKAFVSAEFLNWAPAFRARVERDDPNGFYAAAARLAEQAVKTFYHAA
ncbi:MAG: molecular chaperone TorD family protein [Rhodospirillaceae bacterium]